MTSVKKHKTIRAGICMVMASANLWSAITIITDFGEIAKTIMMPIAALSITIWLSMTLVSAATIWKTHYNDQP